MSNTKLSIFIGSSSEGLDIARKVQMLLEHDANCEIWNHGTFKLGESYLESLENAVNFYDFGIFIFTPDDTIVSRGVEKKITRDNVIFELGLFVGKLSRKRAFIIHPKSNDLHLLSDFSGISTASYDATHSNILSALEIPCEKIRVETREALNNNILEKSKKGILESEKEKNHDLEEIDGYYLPKHIKNNPSEKNKY